MTRQPRQPTCSDQYSEAHTIKRRDEAVRRALNTPPKPYKDSKVGKAKPKPSSPSGKRGGA
jgi:hypothetical protein